MASSISDERNELQDDDQKLQTALHEFANRWGNDDYSEDDEEDDLDEDQLLIDLEYEPEQAGHSLTPSLVGSASQSQSLTAADEESGETVPRPNLQLPSQIAVVEDGDDYKKTLYLNRTLQDILEEHINNIKAALKENKEKQARLEENALDITALSEKKRSYTGSFRAPYFRLYNNYPLPNEDVKQKKLSQDYEIVAVDSKDFRFNKTAKGLLREAVLGDCLERILKPLIIKMESEIIKRDKLTEEFEERFSKLNSETARLGELQKSPLSKDAEYIIEEVKRTIEELKKSLEEKGKKIDEHKKEITKLEQEIENKRNIPENEILATVDTNKVDWMKIAKQNLGGHHNWLDCQKAWENLVSPNLNRKTWSKEEDKKLVSLVTKSTTGDWTEIARDLGNNRTPFQCFSRYQQRFNSHLKPRPWTDEEDAKLIRITNNVKDTVGFFSWSKVSSLIDSRSPAECMYRFTKIDPSQSRGRWTPVEDAKLLAAVQMIGPSWSKVAKFIGSRNMVQCRDRYLNCLAPNINFSHFSYDEDIKLLKLYKKYGPCWSKMVPEFKGRTDGMLLSRYRILQKWKQQAEWFNKQSLKTKEMLLGKSLTVAERQQFKAKASDYLHEKLGIVPEDYKRQEIDRMNKIDPDIIPPRPPRHLRCYALVGSNRKGSIKKWSMKLDIHQRLTENLHKLLQKEAEASKEKKGKGPNKLAPEITEKIMQQSVEETLQENPKVKLPYTKGQVKRLEAALNKAFLTEGVVSVQDLIKSSVAVKKRPRKVEKNMVVDYELKSIIRKRGRTLSKHGRSRRFFERDTRPLKDIEDELDELDHSVPLMLIKHLGGDLHSLCNAIRLQCLQFQEELSKLPSYEEDLDFKTEDADIKELIHKLLLRTDITETCKQERLSALEGKLKTLRKIYNKKRQTDIKIVENKVSSFQEDLDYLESLLDEKMEVEVDTNMSILNYGSLETEFVGEILESGTSSCSPNQCSLSTTSVSQSKSSMQHQANNMITASIPDGDGESETTENGGFAVPDLPTRAKRTRYSARPSSKSELLQKQFKVLSEEEIASERKRLPDVKKRIFTKLPYLPPSLSTLLGLRALLLMKNDLIDTAGDLYKCTYLNPASQSGTDSATEMQGGNISRCEIPADNSGSWFLDSDPRQVTNQTKNFPGYLGSQRGLSKRRFFNDSQTNGGLNSETNEQGIFSSENETITFPLEERGGHLPNSGSKHRQEIDNDVKPIMVEERVATAKQAGKNSSYEVVMGYSGPSEGPSPRKKVERPSVRKIADSNQPAGQSGVSVMPASLIKVDPATTTMTVHTASVSSSSSNITVASTSGSGSSVEGFSAERSSGTGVYSLQTAAQSQITKCDVQKNGEDDDVVAVIHIDDDDNLTPTVINICSKMASDQWSELSTNEYGEIVLISENGQTSQPMKTAESECQDLELNELELPENCVRSIMSNKRLKNHQSRIVIVGVDEESKNIVHFKNEKDKFTAYEAVGTHVAEARVGRQRGVWTEEDENQEKVRDIPACLRAIRQSDEYKLLNSRFHALFMWPVLMSTIKPSPLNDGSLPTGINQPSQQGAESSQKRKQKKKQLRGRKSKSLREHWQLIRKCSLESRRKKKREKMMNLLTENEKINYVNNEEMDIEDASAVRSEQGATMALLYKGNGQNISDRTRTLTKGEVEGDDVEKSAADIEKSAADGDNISEEPQPKKRRRRRRPAPLPEPRERPRRNVKKVRIEAPPVVEPVREVTNRLLPQWWKDAILSTMLAKRAMEMDGEEDVEVNISEDEDFIDKGNYSDDEWYQELRKAEMKEAQEKSLAQEICNSGLASVVPQDLISADDKGME